MHKSATQQCIIRELQPATQKKILIAVVLCLAATCIPQQPVKHNKNYYCSQAAAAPFISAITGK